MQRIYDPTVPAHAAFVREVERRMDEVTPDGETPREQAAKLYAFAVEACDAVLGGEAAADVAALAESAGPGEPIEDAYGRVRGVRVALGPDVLHVVSARLAGWHRTVFVAVPPAQAYELETNPHHVRPLARPAVYLVPDAGGTAVECYPAGEADPEDDVRVVLRQRPEAVSALYPDISARIAWDAAARALTAERYTVAAADAARMAAPTP